MKHPVIDRIVHQNYLVIKERQKARGRAAVKGLRTRGAALKQAKGEIADYLARNPAPSW